jgi:hypothetical protein
MDGLDQHQLALLLGGACDGDANHGTGSEQRTILHTSSINLAMIYSALMHRLGVAHSFGRRPTGDLGHISYDLCINREFEHLILSQYQKPPIIGSNSFGRNSQDTVYRLDRRQYSGPVFNFEVMDDHSYVVNGIAVHNCEDCDFYARLSRGSVWRENRHIAMLHLWHDRVPGWMQYHARNKQLEEQLKALPAETRIAQQRQWLSTSPWARFLK